MKKRLPFLLILAATALLTACSPNGNANTNFWVRGNCEMCQERIVKSIKSVPGVTDASYDLETHLATVQFDSTKTNPAALQSACANVGHETKAEKSSPDAIQSLPNCCKPGAHM